jgi:protein-S-isoprenylcysteine O-methyltransferase
MQPPRIYFICGSAFTFGAVYPSALSIFPVISAAALLLFIYMNSREKTNITEVSIVRGYDLLVLVAVTSAEYFLTQAVSVYLKLWLVKMLGATGIVASVISFYITVEYLVANSGKKFIRDGPYRLVRHPMYSSLVLFWCSACIYLFCLSSLAVFLWFIKNRMSERIRVEEKALAGTAVEYLEYRRSVWSGVPFHR